MASLRSQETLQKEYDLQAEYTTRINLELQRGSIPNYKETLEDYAVFANVLRKVAPEKTLVLLHPRPEIILQAESEGYEVSLFISGRIWLFKVNKSVHYILPPELAAGAGLLLKRMWDATIPCLPEGFIIRGKIDRRDPKEETEARTKIQQNLGFSLPQIDDFVYGVVRDKKLHPITLEEVITLTGEVPDHLDQKFNVRKIDWPGA
jgi:hypothetical protein